ncbi:hypothetical protein T484DRAFT_3650059, partial [Baffinella frigidus]
FGGTDGRYGIVATTESFAPASRGVKWRREARNLAPEIRNSEFQTRNPKPETQGRWSGAWQPETRNLKPEIRNPKPE